MLSPAKLQFTGLAEDFRHLTALATFNPLVKVLKTPAQALPESPAHACLAGAHEPDQNYGRCPKVAAGRQNLPAERTTPRRFIRAFSRPFSPNRFSLRFLYCFSERFLR